MTPRATAIPVYYLLHGSPGRPEVYYAIAAWTCGSTTSSACTASAR